MIKLMVKVLKESIKAVPAMKYALAVAGIMAVVGLVSAFRLSPQTAVFGAVIVLVLMVAMVIFARLAATGPKHFVLPVLVMLWSFLALVVATASLLFSCAFFQWPKAINDLIGTHGSNTRDTSMRVSNLLAGARVQLDTHDYKGAWQGVDEAVGLAPNSKPAKDLQLQVAMAWLRELEVVSPATHSEVVDRISPCLYRSVSDAKGTLAADIYAHLGWGNYLKWREGGVAGKIEDNFKKAVEFEPTNPFAQAMWGYWLVIENRQLAEAKAHFQKAFESGREKRFVRHLQLSALEEGGSMENTRELLRISNEIRKAKETATQERRQVLFNHIYGRVVNPRSDMVEETISLLPAPEHLATFIWLTDGIDLDESVGGGFFHARLTEAAGDFPNAMSLYRLLLAEDTVYKEVIQAGLDRCRKQAGGGRSEAQALLDQARSGDTATRVKVIRSLPRAGVEPAEVLPALVSWVKDDDKEVRGAAGDALAQFGAPAVGQVVTLLSSPQNRDVLSGVKILGQIGQEPKAAVPALSRVLKPADTEVSEAAADALAGFGADAAPAVPALLDLLAHTTKRSLQQSIAYAFGEIGPAANQAVPQLMSLVQSDKEPDGALRDVAAASLGKIGPGAAEAVPLLAAALKSDDVRLLSIAAEALGNIGAPAKRAIPALLNAMRADEKEHQNNYAEPVGRIASALMDAGDKDSLPTLKSALSALELANAEPRMISPVREAIEGLKQKP
jgi:HEAT repeat protein